MDYRKLLAKYIRHVGCFEGVTYLEQYQREDSGGIFTDEEWKELTLLDENVCKVYEKYNEKFADIENDVQKKIISLKQAIEYAEALKKELEKFTWFEEN